MNRNYIKPDYPEIRFVGRKHELNFFNKLLQQKTMETWILYLYGHGGMGKTQLLKKYLEQVKGYQDQGHTVIAPKTVNLIDLYQTEHRREDTLLKSIALHLAPNAFQEFFTTFQDVEHTVEQGFIDEETFSSQERLRQAFLEGYRNLNAERIVLAFDTTEQATRGVLTFFEEILPQMHLLQPGTLILLAGRPEGNTKIEAALPPKTYHSINVTGLSAQDVAEYFAIEGCTSIGQHEINQLAERIEGRPIRVALVIDWLREGNTIEELLAVAPVEFEQSLVMRVAGLRYPQDWIILYMALFDRYFDENILQIVLPIDSMPALDTLTRFSFIKHFPPVLPQDKGTWLLHDEMRDLINKHVWPAQDLSGETRNNSTKSVIEQYYDTEVNKEKSQAKPNRNRLRTLKQERLYYLLKIDLQKGFKYYQELGGEAESQGDSGASYLEALTEEITPYKPKLSSQQKLRLFVNGAIVSSFLPKSSQDIENVKWDEIGAVDQAELRYRIGQFYLRTGQLEKLIRMGAFEDPENKTPSGEWYTWFQDTLKSSGLLPQYHRPITLDFGRLLTTVGTAYRNQNRMNRAVECFQRAITLFESAGNAYVEIANTQNNLGYVYHRMGRTDEAIAECEAALDLRKRLGRPEQLGYSYNVLGMIRVEQLRPEEAEKNFQQALRFFEMTESERGRGLVLIAYGRLLRQWGEYRETIMGEPFEKCIDQYRASEEKFNAAIGIFRSLADLPNLMEALNEKGTLMRQLRKCEEAEKYYNESQGLAKRLGNKYRIADNEVDLGILFYRENDQKRALEHSERASELALVAEAYYLFAKARQTSASAYLKNGEYESAIAAAADAAANILRLDPAHFFESAAKRTLEYERVVKWLKEKVIPQLPDQNLVEQAINIFINRWKTEIVDPRTKKKLKDDFPGFISAMERARRDYQFLKSNPEVES